MLGLPHYHGRFDVVHLRACSNGIKDFPAFIDDMVKCLKPGKPVCVSGGLLMVCFHLYLQSGGVILSMEGDLQLYAENKEPMEAAFDVGGTGSWATRILFGE